MNPARIVAARIVAAVVVASVDVVTVAICGPIAAEQVRGADNPPIFETDIAPLFASRCGKCHSQKVQKGALDLSSIGGLRRGGESGEPAIAETLDDSLLWTLVEARDMPPEGEAQLTEGEIELIRHWIVSGGHSEKPRSIQDKQLNQHDILPIVLLRCTACHGPRMQRGGLDLQTPAAMRKGGRSGPALVPGDPDASLMIQRIESEACPPAELLLTFFVRRPPAAEVETLRNWIAAGATEVDVAPDVATTEPDPLVTDEDRQHWAFQTPQADPNVGSIDRFVEKQLTDADLTFSPMADRDTLIRRAYLDLIGIPPGLEEWSHWHHNTNPDWYHAMIDHLLASPHYGERWGRYWLDVAGYADSEGGISADPVRKVAWKYRDYVIRSFNSDKPYSRFLIEQIAGDELLDHASADVVTEEMVNHLTATGFLRMGIDQTGSRTMNYVPERLGVINDAITVLGSGVLGLTLECARCHSHKYDAIPQRDFYRFKAILKGAFDEYDWLSFKNRSLETATPEHAQRVAKVNPQLTAQLKKLDSQLKQAISTEQVALLQAHFPTLTEADHKATLGALKVADNIRTLPQRLLVEKLQTATIVPDEQQPEPVQSARQQIAELQQQIKQLQRKLEPPLTIRALWDRGTPSPTYLLRRGEHDKPGHLIGPGVPSVLTDGRTPFNVEPPFPDGTHKTGRRLAFARWLTQPEHPLTARVMVNRVWYHHFGAGLVRTMENFGVKGDRPSHPELLDWLAVQFVDRGWSLKELHRLIMNSQTYRQASRVTEQHRQHDAQNRLLSRMSLRRMNAEAIRDTLLFVSGSLDDSPGGPPDPVTVDRDGQVRVDPTSAGKWRRSVYTQYRRTEIPTLMEMFDYPEMGPNCVSRSHSTVSPQSLLLLNNDHIHSLADALANRLIELSRDDVPARIDLLYRLILSRSPTEQERRIGIEGLNQLRRDWSGDEHAALTTYCHTLLNSAAFLYVD
jgi:hypothetical protein